MGVDVKSGQERLFVEATGDLEADVGTPWGKPEENHRKMGNSWENHGETHGKMMVSHGILWDVATIPSGKD